MQEFQELLENLFHSPGSSVSTTNRVIHLATWKAGLGSASCATMGLRSTPKTFA
jgi:hypothetical protein